MNKGLSCGRGRPSMTSESTALKRSLNLPLLVLYGLGTTIGAGIYALTGKVAGHAGMLAPLSFALAAVLAGFTAYSFAELSGRFPRAAAEAVYVGEAFGNARLGTLVGCLVVLAGSVSAATISNGFAGYMNELFPAPSWVLCLGIVAVMCGLASWGIRESVGAAALLTVIELGGLCWVIGVAGHRLLELPARLAEFHPTAEFGWGGVMLGTLLAFYAFLGFEDMVNVAEETKEVRRTLPLAIAITLGTTLLIYVLVALTAVLAVEPEVLAGSDAPLSFLVEQSTGRPALGISVVGVLAMINGALIQIIMASRILYGLAQAGQLPRFLAHVHPRRHTPLLATVFISSLVLILAWSFPLVKLAEVTSLITLVIFSIINAALIQLHHTRPPPVGIVICPKWVPWAGLFVSLGCLGWRVLEEMSF